MNITIIGTGNMGRGVGTRLARGGTPTHPPSTRTKKVLRSSPTNSAKSLRQVLALRSAVTRKASKATWSSSPCGTPSTSASPRG